MQVDPFAIIKDESQNTSFLLYRLGIDPARSHRDPFASRFLLREAVGETMRLTGRDRPRRRRLIPDYDGPRHERIRESQMTELSRDRRATI